MNNKKSEKSEVGFWIRVKNCIINIAKKYCYLNWEAKIGILFLIPPIIGVIMFLCILLVSGFCIENFPRCWNGISYYSGEVEAATPAIPLYLGLMAIAGAYLIKGNLKKKE